MATYNGEKFLSEQLESIAKQALLPVELVVTDDCSTDDTVSILEHFASNAPFVVRIEVNHQRLGYRRNFMKCASLCHGDLIAFCDQDDIWRTDKLLIATQPFQSEKCLLVQHQFFLVDKDRKPIQQSGSSKQTLDGSPWSVVLGFTQVFRRCLLQFNDLFDVSVDHHHPETVMAHDQWFHFIAGSIGSVITLPDALAEYRQHGKNVFGFNHQNGNGVEPLRRSHRAINILIKRKDRDYYHKKAWDSLFKMSVAVEARIQILSSMTHRLEGKQMLQLERALSENRTLVSYIRRRVAIHSESASRTRGLAIFFGTSAAYVSRRSTGISHAYIDLMTGIFRLRTQTDIDGPSQPHVRQTN